MSSVISYKVVDVQPLDGIARATDALPRRLLGRVMTSQDIINSGGFFEGSNRASLFHEGQPWVLTLENDATTDEWNALPHGRDEGAYDTDTHVDRRLQRLFIP